MQQDWTCRLGNIKAINQLKKSINLGEIPTYYSLVATKLSDLEGTFTDGFDNNIKYLLNQKNWQVNNLVAGKPQVSLKKHLSDYAYDLHCFPIIDDEAQVVVNPFDPKSPFKEYNPAVIGPLVRSPNFSEFISMTIRIGDEADMELLKYAHMLIEQLTTLLNERITVVENTGLSIKDIFVDIQQQLNELKMGF